MKLTNEPLVRAGSKTNKAVLLNLSPRPAISAVNQKIGSVRAASLIFYVLYAIKYVCISVKESKKIYPELLAFGRFSPKVSPTYLLDLF